MSVDHPRLVLATTMLASSLAFVDGSVVNVGLPAIDRFHASAGELLGASFSGEARGRAIGIWASTGSAVATLGPVLGGWLIDTVGWQAIFLLNIPLAAIAIGLAGLTWGLTVGSGPEGWTPAALVTVSVGAVLMLAFIWAEKTGRRPCDDAVGAALLMPARRAA